MKWVVVFLYLALLAIDCLSGTSTGSKESKEDGVTLTPEETRSRREQLKDYDEQNSNERIEPQSLHRSSEAKENFNGLNQGENSGKYVNGIYSHGADNVRYVSGADSNDLIGGVLKLGPNKLHLINEDQGIHSGNYVNGIVKAGTGHQIGDLSDVLNRGLNKPHIVSEIVNPGTLSRKYLDRIGGIDDVNYVAETGYAPHQNEFLNNLLNQARDVVDSSGTANLEAVPGTFENGILPQEGSTDQYAVVENQDANSKYLSDILTQAQRLLKYGAVPTSYGVTPAHYHPIPRWSVYRPPNHGIRVYDVATDSYMGNPSSPVIDDEVSVSEGIPAYVIPAPVLNGYPNRPGYYRPPGPGYVFGTDRTVPTTIFGRNPEDFYRQGPILTGGGILENNGGNVDESGVLFDKTLSDYVVVPFDNNDEGTSRGALETVIGTDKIKYGTRTFRHDGRLKRDETTSVTDNNDGGHKIVNGALFDKTLQQNDKHGANNEKIHKRFTTITEAIKTDGFGSKDRTSNNRKSTIVKDTNSHNTNESKKDLINKNMNDNNDTNDGVIKTGNSEVIENITVIKNTDKVSKKDDKRVKAIKKDLGKDDKSDITGNNNNKNQDRDKSDENTTVIKNTGKEDDINDENVKTVKKNTGTNDGTIKQSKSVVIENTKAFNTNIEKENTKKDKTVETTEQNSERDENSDITGNDKDGNIKHGEFTVIEKTIVVKNGNKDKPVGIIENGSGEDSDDNDGVIKDSKPVVTEKVPALKKGLGKDNESEGTLEHSKSAVIENTAAINTNTDKDGKTNGKEHKRVKTIEEGTGKDKKPDVLSNDKGRIIKHDKSTVIVKTTVIKNSNNVEKDSSREYKTVKTLKKDERTDDEADAEDNDGDEITKIDESAVIKNTDKVAKNNGKDDKRVTTIKKDEKSDITGNNDDLIIKDSEPTPIKDTVQDGKGNGKKAEPVKTIKKVTGTKDGSNASDNNDERITKADEFVVIKNKTVIKNTNIDGETNNKKDTTVKTIDKGSEKDQKSDVTGSDDDGITKTGKTIVIINSDQVGKSNEKEDTAVETIEKSLRKDDELDGYENNETKQGGKFVLIKKTTVVTKTFKDGGDEEIVDESSTDTKKDDGKDLEVSDDVISKGDKPRVTIKLTGTKSIEKEASSNGKESSVIDKISQSKNSSEESNEDKNDEISGEDYDHDDDDDDDDNDASKSIEGDESSKTRNYKDEQSTNIDKVLKQNEQNNGNKTNATDSKNDGRSIKTATGTNDGSADNVGDSDNSNDEEIGENYKTRVTIKRTVTKSIEKRGSSNSNKSAMVDKISQTKKKNDENKNEDYAGDENDDDESDNDINNRKPNEKSTKIYKDLKQSNGNKTNFTIIGNDVRYKDTPIKTISIATGTNDGLDNHEDSNDDEISENDKARVIIKIIENERSGNRNKPAVIDKISKTKSDNTEESNEDQNDETSTEDFDDDEYYDDNNESDELVKNDKLDDSKYSKSTKNYRIIKRNRQKNGYKSNSVETENEGTTKDGKSKGTVQKASQYEFKNDDWSSNEDNNVDDVSDASDDSIKAGELKRNKNKTNKKSTQKNDDGTITAYSQNDVSSETGGSKEIIGEENDSSNDEYNDDDGSSRMLRDSEEDEIGSGESVTHAGIQDRNNVKTGQNKGSIKIDYDEDDDSDNESGESDKNDKVRIYNSKKNKRNNQKSNSADNKNDGGSNDGKFQVIIKKTDKYEYNDGLKYGDGASSEYYDDEDDDDRDDDADTSDESDEDGAFERNNSKIDKRNTKVDILERKRPKNDRKTSSTDSALDETSKDSKLKVIMKKADQYENNDGKKDEFKNSEGSSDEDYNDDNANESEKNDKFGRNNSKVDKRNITIYILEQKRQIHGDKINSADSNKDETPKDGESKVIDKTTDQDDNNDVNNNDDSSADEDYDNDSTDDNAFNKSVKGRRNDNKNKQSTNKYTVLGQKNVYITNFADSEDDGASKNGNSVDINKTTGQDENNGHKHDSSNEDSDNDARDKSDRDGRSDSNKNIESIKIDEVIERNDQNINSTDSENDARFDDEKLIVIVMKTGQYENNDGKKDEFKKEARSTNEYYDNKDDKRIDKSIRDDESERKAGIQDNNTKTDQINNRHDTKDDFTNGDSLNNKDYNDNDSDSSSKSIEDDKYGKIDNTKEKSNNKADKVSDDQTDKYSQSKVTTKRSATKSSNDGSVIIDKTNQNQRKKNIYHEKDDARNKKDFESINASNSDLEELDDDDDNSKNDKPIDLNKTSVDSGSNSGKKLKVLPKIDNVFRDKNDGDDSTDGGEFITKKTTESIVNSKDTATDNTENNETSKTNEHDNTVAIQNDNKVTSSKLTNNHTDTKDNNEPYDTNANANQQSTLTEEDKAAVAKNKKDLHKYNSTETNNTVESADVSEQKNTTSDLNNEDVSENKDTETTNDKTRTENKAFKTRKPNKRSQDAIDFGSRRNDGHGRSNQGSFRRTAINIGCRRCNAALKTKQYNTSPRRCYRTKIYGPKIQKEEYKKSTAETESVPEESLVKEGQKSTLIKSPNDSKHTEIPGDSKYIEKFEDSESKGIKSGQDSVSEDEDKSSSDSFTEGNDGKGSKKSVKDFSSKEDATKQASSSRESKSEDSNGNTTGN